MNLSKKIGVKIPQVLLPNRSIDLTRWAVIACDQFTSQPEYWEAVAEYVGNSPSTLHLILPEVYLGSPQEAERIAAINRKMWQYLSDGFLTPQNSMIYVERTVDGKTRHGLMLALDLEQYDFHNGSQSLIRATEGTILDRLPPRVRIRKDAPLELPHILVLIDDPKDRVIGGIRQSKDTMPVLYDFDLMQNSGHLAGRSVDNEALEKEVIHNLELLARPDVFYPKYNVNRDKSLATAKSIWEELKPQVGMDHPARYALVEIENIHDAGLRFEPIHRVLFGMKTDLKQALYDQFGQSLQFKKVRSKEEMVEEVKHVSPDAHTFGLIQEDELLVGTLSHPVATLAVGSLQPLLDRLVKSGQTASIDYVHGEETVFSLGNQAGNAGIFLPALAKDDLFRTVILEGALPRKTFSMGEAHEKRFYMEARKIVP